MSRWNHEFSVAMTRWKEIVDAKDNLKARDPTVITEIEEVARFSKVVQYLDGILSAIEPDLLPINTWPSLSGGINNVLVEISNYIQTGVLGHLQNANTNIDIVLSYVRPYAVSDISGLTSLSHALEVHRKVLEDGAIDLESKLVGFVVKSAGLVVDITRLAENASEEKNRILNESNLLFSPDGMVQKIADMESECRKNRNELADFYNEVLINTNESKSIKSVLEETKAKVSEISETILEIADEAKGDIVEFNEFYASLFDGDDSYKIKAATLLKKMEDFESEQKIKYLALNQQIDNLLPGATSAGLSSAYSEMRGSFDSPIKSFTVVFYMVVAIMLILGVVTHVQSISWQGVQFLKFDSWDTVFNSFISNLPFYGPMLWLAYFCTKRRSECQRLQQEYAHKEALAKSYDKYKRQIDELQGADQKILEELIVSMIRVISHNPSVTLDGRHGDKVPTLDAAEKIINQFTGTAQKIKEIIKS